MNKILLLLPILFFGIGISSVNAADTLDLTNIKQLVVDKEVDLVTLKEYEAELSSIIKEIEITDVRQQCSSALELINKFLPDTIGNVEEINRLLQVKPDDWFSRFQGERFVSLLNTEFPKFAVLPQSKTTGQFESEDAVLKFKLTHGEVRFINRALMRVDLDNTRSVEDKQGIAIVRELLDSLGILEYEVDFDKMRSKILKAGLTSPKQAPSLEQSIDFERTYFIPRVVNDLQVQQSIIIAGVNNQAELSHFRIKWPMLKLAREKTDRVVSRAEMTNNIYRWVLTIDEQCDKTAARFGMYVAYVPVKQATDDKDDVSENIYSNPVFLPQLVVFYLPASKNEGGIVESFDLF